MSIPFREMCLFYVKPLSLALAFFGILFVDVIRRFPENKLSYIFCATKQHEDTRGRSLSEAESAIQLQVTV